jgi:hypothetical protein
LQRDRCAGAAADQNWWQQRLGSSHDHSAQRR